MNVIKNAIIYTMENDLIIKNGYIAFDNKIIEVSEGQPPEELLEDALVFDAHGGVVMPGLIDAHTHIGGVGDSLGFESDDINEITDPIAPQLNSLDCVNPLDRCFKEALKNGVTTVATGPGSANAIAGKIIVTKTFGHRIDDMVINSPAAMKFALGENPKGCYHGKNQAPETRMSTAALIREALSKALKYREDIDNSKKEDCDEPEFDSKCDALLPVIKGELPVHIHAHRADDIFTAIRIAKEYNLSYNIVHCTDGHLIAKDLKKENVVPMIGPFLCDRSKPELSGLTLQNCAILEEAGIEFAIITDHPVIPVQFLLLCASLAVKGGMTELGALKAITINPAKILRIDDRVGSLKVGKDADIVLYNSEPLNIFSKIKAVFCDGCQVF